MALKPSLFYGDPDINMDVALVGTINTNNLCFVAWSLHH